MKIKKDTVNLIPRSRKFSNDFLLLLALVLSFIIIIQIGIKQNYRKRKLAKHLSSVKASNQQRVNEIEKMNIMIKEIELKNQFKRKLTTLKSTKITWTNYFKELTLIIPDSIWIERMKVKNIDGRIELFLKGQSTSQMHVSTFYERLSKSYYYNKILIKYSEVDEEYSPRLVKFEFATDGIFNFSNKREGEK